MWATTSTVKAIHEMRHSTRIRKHRSNPIQWVQRERIPAATLGRAVTAR